MEASDIKAAFTRRLEEFQQLSQSIKELIEREVGIKIQDQSKNKALGVFNSDFEKLWVIDGDTKRAVVKLSYDGGIVIKINEGHDWLADPSDLNRSIWYDVLSDKNDCDLQGLIRKLRTHLFKC